ncbi:MAG TPA: hypothetical protein VGC64_10985, partial [Pyrinomonadaceae bacterium]
MPPAPPPKGVQKTGSHFINWITYGFFALVILVIIVGVAFKIRQRLLASRTQPAPPPGATLKQTLAASPLKVKSVAFAAGGRLIVAGCNDGSIKVWDAETGSLVRTLRGHERDVRAVAVSPDGQLVLSGGADRSLRLWDVSTGELKQTLHEHQGEVFTVAFAPDGRTWAS